MATKYYTEIVPFELAKKLKDAGYKEECSGHYAKDGYLWETHPKQNSNDTENFFSAPTYAEVFDWLMGKGLSVKIQIAIGNAGWIISAICWGENWCDISPATFHEAANAAIEKACEILKKNG